MKVRELAHLTGFGKRYFFAFWSRNMPVYQALKPLHDASGALFIHIPKTAGVSVCSAVYDTDQLLGHAPAIGWKHHDPLRYSRLLTFSFMREPTNRFFSAFYYLRSGALTQKDNDFAARYLSAFDTPDMLLAAMTGNALLRARVMSWVHFTPQSWYLTDQTGAVILDYIGQVEKFDEGMTEVTSRIGKTYTPIHNNSSKRPRALELSAASRDLLGKLYADDFRLYHDRFGEG